MHNLCVDNKVISLYELGVLNVRIFLKTQVECAF